MLNLKIGDTVFWKDWSEPKEGKIIKFYPDNIHVLVTVEWQHIKRKLRLTQIRK